MSANCERDWISYSDKKCLKVLEKKGSESEAKENCMKMDSSSTLITIESKDENDFISNHIMKYKTISAFVWIGLEYIDKSFQWMDGKRLIYANWDENAIKDGNSKCVQMSLAESDLGQWMDDLCQKKYLIVCQKKQLTKTVSTEEFKNLTKFIEKLQATLDEQDGSIKIQQTINANLDGAFRINQARIESIQSINEKQKMTNEKQQATIEKLKNELESNIPLGYLYTQLPDQSPPEKLWPNMKWSEVTQQYSGLFFRAEGGGSEPFGRTQSANYSKISKIRYCSFNDDHGGSDSWHPHEMEEGWTGTMIGHGLRYLELFTKTAENRPRNTAIRIWKRIQ